MTRTWLEQHAQSFKVDQHTLPAMLYHQLYFVCSVITSGFVPDYSQYIFIYSTYSSSLSKPGATHNATPVLKVQNSECVVLVAAIMAERETTLSSLT